jgi:hypothetical protein
MKKFLKKYYLVLVGLVVVVGIVFLVKYIITSRQASQANIGTITIPDKEPDYTLPSINDKKDYLTTISNFEDNEPVWEGNYASEDKVIYQGKKSLSMISTGHKGVSATLESSLDFQKMQFVEFMLNIADVDAYEKLTITFGDKDLTNYYSYDLTNLKAGWNLVQIAKEKFNYRAAEAPIGIGLNVAPAGLSVEKWSNIGKVKLYAIARPLSILYVRFDALKAINNFEGFTSAWTSTNLNSFFTLTNDNNVTNLLIRNIGAYVAVLKNSPPNDYVLDASFSPQSTGGRSGLLVRGNYKTLYGYYFLIGGEGKNTWQLIKKNKAGWVKEGFLDSTFDAISLSSASKYWLRIATQGDLMEVYFSTDGKFYNKLGSVSDSEFTSGSAGIAVLDGGKSIVDNVEFRLLK